MKRALFSAALLTSSMASASTAIDGWYISGFGGVSDVSAFININNVGSFSSPVKYKLGYNAGARLGYQGTPMRYEFEYTYVHANTKRLSFDELGLINGQVSANILMAKLYYDFPELLDTISPFIGGGIGYSLVRTSLNGTGLLGINLFNLSSNQFTYQGIAGLTYNFSENYAINANYRYTASTNSTRFARSFQVQMGNAGIIYRFDGCDYK